MKCVFISPSRILTLTHALKCVATTFTSHESCLDRQTVTAVVVLFINVSCLHAVGVHDADDVTRVLPVDVRHIVLHHVLKVLLPATGADFVFVEGGVTHVDFLYCPIGKLKLNVKTHGVVSSTANKLELNAEVDSI